MNPFLIIRGPLGVGKSTIATKLAQKIGGKYMSIDDILAQNHLDQISPQDGCIPLANFQAVNRLIIPEIRRAILAGTPVVVDGNFYHRDQIDGLISNFPTNSHVFTLTASLEICLRRDSQRAKAHGIDATTEVYHLVSKFAYGRVVDTSTLTPDQAVDLIIFSLAHS